jgi:uncharacterized protein (DUF111 family)
VKGIVNEDMGAVRAHLVSLGVRLNLLMDQVHDLQVSVDSMDTRTERILSRLTKAEKVDVPDWVSGKER